MQVASIMWRMRGGISILGFLLVFIPTVFAHAERIRSFDAHYVIAHGGEVMATEAITYDFEGLEKHGIYRDIPLTAVNGPTLLINVISVTDTSGGSYTFTTTEEGGNVHVRIGDPDVLVSGVKKYIIVYEVRNALRQFSDHDELYWNVTGNGWSVPIDAVSAITEVYDAPLEDATYTCFTGGSGSTNTDCVSTSDGGKVSYVSTKPFGAGEGMTIVLGIKKGVLDIVPVVIPQSSAQSGGANGAEVYGKQIFAFVIAFGAIIFSRLLRGLKKKKTFIKPDAVIPSELKGRPVVVAYEPPDSLAPIDVGTILDRRVDITDISSMVMHLAIRGYLKIRYTVEVIRFWPDKEDFEFVKLKDGSDLTHPAEMIMFGLLFGLKDTITLSELTDSSEVFYKTFEDIKKKTEDGIFAKGYFDQQAKDAAVKIIAIPFASGALLFLSLFILDGVLSSILPLIVIATVASIFISIWYIIAQSHKLTSRGMETLSKILGFQEFLRLTEQDKLRLLNAPALKPETFEKFLPYAMVLGVEDEWATKFEKLYTTAPQWYEDTTSHTFSSQVLMASLSSFNTSFNQAFAASAPQSHSSGFSGGSSGGGGGGGGGGSW